MTPVHVSSNGNGSRSYKNGNSEAMRYRQQLLSEGCNEGINEAELQLPLWYDVKRFQEGQRYIRKYRFFMHISFLIGFIASLAIPSIRRIMNCTHRSSTSKMAFRRYMGTILHTLSWYYEPLEPGSRLWESLSTVRRSHFQANRLCLKAEAGRITQKDLALTQFSLIGFFMLEADRMGLRDEAFLEGSAHMWRVLGSLLGIKDKYNVCLESWRETKPRFQLLMECVFRPALTSANSEFFQMTETLIEGLRPVHYVLTADATLFYTKILAGCKGYEFLQTDFYHKDSSWSKESYYYAMKMWDRVIVSTAVYTFTFLYKYRAVRWYLNFFGWVNELFMTYFPYLAICKYGWKWTYSSIRLFKTNK